MGWFDSVLKFQKKFDPLSYHISKAVGLVPGQDNPAAPQAAFSAPRPFTGFGQQQAPSQMPIGQMPMGPARPLVGAPRAPMGQPLPMGQPGAPRPLVGAPRLQQQATVNALRAPTPIA